MFCALPIVLENPINVELVRHDIIYQLTFVSE